MIWDNFDDSLRAYLWAEQEAFELRAVDEGIARYRKYRAEADACTLGPEKQLINEALDTYILALEQLQDETKKRKVKRGKPQMWWDALLDADLTQLAFVALTQTLTMATMTGPQRNRLGHNTVTNVSRAITDSYEECLLVAAIRKHNKKLWDEERVRWRNLTSRAMAAIKKKAGVQLPPWGPKEKARFGNILLHTMVRSTRTVSINKKWIDGRTFYMVELLDDVRSWIETQHSDLELLARTSAPPCVVPPRPWENTTVGGWHYYLGRGLTLDKGLNHETDRDCIKLAATLEAVNHLQATPWLINKPVLEVVRQFWTTGTGVAGIPDGVQPVPPYPDDGSDQQIKEWKSEASAIHSFNAKTQSKRVNFNLALDQASRLASKPAFWFVQALDFRGRAYPLCRSLNQQTHDSSKGLLMFADSKPLGDRGFYWLRVNLANLHGQDKISLDSRVEWADGYLETRCKGKSFDPFEDRSWCDADKPIQALATTLELLNALDSQDPASFESCLPVAVDGTCNGLQHLAAAGRDPVGGRLVNLIDSELPADAYQVVSQRAEELLPAMADSQLESDLAKMWAGKIERKVVKRATMTTPYGVTSQGVTNQLLEDGFIEKLGCGDHPKFKAARFLMRVIEEAKGIEMVAATAIMEWFRQVAVIANDTGQPIQWTTPIGFQVCQKYLQYQIDRIRTPFQKLSIALPPEDAVIDSRKQYRGLPPNVVHSWDGSHMMGTVIRLKDRGIEHIATVHDSYATHACDIDVLNEELRTEFVEMHSRHLLSEFKDEVESHLGVELPSPPPLGDLDITEVRNSTYFFS